MKTVMYGLRLTEHERNAFLIAARRRGISAAQWVRSLLSEDENFRRELARVKREAVSEERLVSV